MNGEVIDYYENGQIKGILNYKDGFMIFLLTS